MNKILMWITFLLWTVLVIVNMISSQPMLFINTADNWVVVFVAIIIWIVGWFAIKWFILEKLKDKYNNNEEEWIKF